MVLDRQPLVLCYHAVSDSWDDVLSVRPAAFEHQLRIVLRRGYRAATATEAVSRHGKLAHVTFDDAFTSVENALPVLERLRVPATVFACPGFAREGRPLDVPELAESARNYPSELATMDWDALRDLADRGIEIGSHTVSHAHLPLLTETEIRSELTESRDEIETNIGRPCRFLAYPYGEHDARCRAEAARAGYEAAFALGGRRPLERHAYPRVPLWRSDGDARALVKTSRLGREVLTPAFGALRAVAPRARPRSRPRVG